MIRLRGRFWLALLLLLGWHLPALATIGIGLHLAGEDHASDELALELVLAAAHGHHHTIDVAPHDHVAVRVQAPAAPQSEDGTTIAPVPAALVVIAEAAVPKPATAPPRIGPPELFYKHCTLRL